MNPQIRAIAHYTALEGRRTRVLIIAVIGIAAIIAASVFVRELAVAEGGRFQTGFYAPMARLCAVFMIAVHVLGSVLRELEDKGLELLLASDLPRSHYVLGKWLGFSITAASVALIVTLPLLALHPWQAVLVWGLSLLLELLMMVTLAQFCIVTFTHLLPAAGFLAAFYLFARNLTAIRLMAEHPIAAPDALSQQLMVSLIDALAFVTPALDRWTQTAWLVSGSADWPALANTAVQAAIYVLMLLAATLFDLYRRNF